MSNITEYKEVMAFHPGYYIAEIIEEMGISQAEFATRLGTTAKTVSTLVNGQIALSNDIAKKLSSMLGTSVEIWLDLQKSYEEKLILIEQRKELDEQQFIARMIDYSFFVRAAGLENTRDIDTRIINLCKYLRISSLKVLMDPDFLVNYRRATPCFEEKNVVNSRAWIQTAINCSKDLSLPAYNERKLRTSLGELRGMTIQQPEVFLPRMKEIFSECGVVFVLLPYLKNSGINGAVKWINSDRPLISMNDRGAYADRFWFALFHEIKHVFQKKLKTTFVDCTESEKIRMDSEWEREADVFARNFLIPAKAYSKFAPTKYTTDEEIIDFADSIGIHPGIVAGRMQKEAIIPHSRCANLKEKYQIL